jgi:hypothetical protein
MQEEAPVSTQIGELPGAKSMMVFWEELATVQALSRDSFSALVASQKFKVWDGVVEEDVEQSQGFCTNVAKRSQERRISVAGWGQTVDEWLLIEEMIVSLSPRKSLGLK